MKYVIFILIALTIFVIGVFGLRGQRFTQPPIEIFPDMDRQSYIQGQEPSDFFADGLGSRPPVPGTIPHASDNGVFSLEFGEGRTGHYYTGAIDDYFANGLPLEKLDIAGEDAAGDMAALLRRGEERYGIFCAICHGETGDGAGVISRYMTAKIANLHEPRFGSDQYPDGKVFHVITYGQGLMSGYGANIPVPDRWAIVAYMRALQEAEKASAGGAAPQPGPDGEAAPEAPVEVESADEPAAGAPSN